MQMTSFNSSANTESGGSLQKSSSGSDTTSNNSRNCARRDSRWSKEKVSSKEISHSNHSVLYTMDKFVRTVEDMNETILVPCRLMDMRVGEETSPDSTGNHDPRAKRLLHDTDLYSFYTMLNTVKNELLWGNKGSTSSTPSSSMDKVDVPSSTAPSEVKGHVRRSSTVSMTSSTSVSDTDSEASSINNDNEVDSGVENEEDYTQQVADNFRRHLHGLHHSLRELTSAAEFVTSRYQSDIGGSS